MAPPFQNKKASCDVVSKLPVSAIRETIRAAMLMFRAFYASLLPKQAVSQQTGGTEEADTKWVVNVTG